MNPRRLLLVACALAVSTPALSSCGSTEADQEPGGGGAGAAGSAGAPDGGLDSAFPDAGPDAIVADAPAGDGDASSKPDSDAAVGPEGSDAPWADSWDGAVAHECALGGKLCTSHDARLVCKDTPQGRRWVAEVCPGGQGCVKGDCVTGACSDECNLGEQNGGKKCELYDMGSKSWVAPKPAQSMHDRARAYNQWLRRDGMAAGGVGSARYADPPTYAKITYMDGIGDSAIWTGTYLAAEALRLQATGAADARANVLRLVDTMHLWLNVAGDPGLLSRYAVPSGTQFPFTVGDLQCGKKGVHCGVPYGGKNYDYIGHISRDQYQGVLLGLALAYEALGEHDEPARVLIRENVVELVEELMKERSVPTLLTINGGKLPVMNLAMRFVVLAKAEMNNGAVELTVSTSNPDASEMWGFQEFVPDLADLLRQVPGFGWVPNIPRASSAIMLASFFRVGMLVTQGIASYQARRDAMIQYYVGHQGTGGNIDSWLNVAATFSASTKCGESYFGNNITMEPLYNLARLEDDASRKARITESIFNKTIWPYFRTTKNPFFSYIYAGTVPGFEASAPTIATQQLAGFPPPPRVRVHVDLRNDPKYMPHESGCVDQVSHNTAVDVAERPVGDFLWQRHPWGLYDDGDPSQTQPGVDYLVAYWMGRLHAFVSDDSSGRCLAWR